MRQGIEYEKISKICYTGMWLPFSSVIIAVFLYILGPEKILIPGYVSEYWVHIFSFPLEYQWMHDPEIKYFELQFVLLGDFYFILTFITLMLTWAFGSLEWRKLVSFRENKYRKSICIAIVQLYAFSVIMVYMYDRYYENNQIYFDITVILCAAPLFKGGSALNLFLGIASVFLKIEKKSI